MGDLNEYFDKSTLLLTLNSFSSSVSNFNMGLVKFYANQKDYGCVYVSVNRPYVSVLKELEKNNIKQDNLYVVDMISKVESRNFANKKKVLFVSSPSSLTEASIAITSALELMQKKKKIVLFESASTMNLYNSENKMVNFFHFFINKLRNDDTKVTIVDTRDISHNVVKQLVQFCDMHLEVDDNFKLPLFQAL